MSYLVWRKDVEIWLTAAILTAICPVSRCANNSTSASMLKHLPFPNEPPCHILHERETLLLRCHFDGGCENWWCHQDPGTTAYLIMPEGESFGANIFTSTDSRTGTNIGQDRYRVSGESVLLIEVTSMFDAGQYLCVCAAKNLSYKIDVAVINVSATAKPRCNRRVELTFGGVIEPVNLDIYKWICLPFSARLVQETTKDNSKLLEIELDIVGDVSSNVACYFYLRSPDYSCGVRLISVAFQIHTKDDMCNIELLKASAANSVTFSPNARRLAFLLLIFLLNFVIVRGRFEGDGVVTRLIQLQFFNLS